jgi:hypothetical protein
LAFDVFLVCMIYICVELVESISFDYLYALIKGWITNLHMLRALGKRKKEALTQL